MPKMPSTDAAIHAAHDLIHAIQNPAPDIPLVTLGNANKNAFRSLAYIFEKETSHNYLQGCQLMGISRETPTGGPIRKPD